MKHWLGLYYLGFTILVLSCSTHPGPVDSDHSPQTISELGASPGTCGQTPAPSNYNFTLTSQSPFTQNLQSSWKDNSTNELNFTVHVLCRSLGIGNLTAEGTFWELPKNTTNFFTSFSNIPSCAAFGHLEVQSFVNADFQDGTQLQSCNRYFTDYAPLNFTGKVKGNQVELSWVDDYLWNTEFQIFYKDLNSSDPEETLSIVSGNTSQEIHYNVKQQHTYQYRIRACYWDYCSPLTSPIFVLVPFAPTDKIPLENI